jgi:hypothetical protein
MIDLQIISHLMKIQFNKEKPGFGKKFFVILQCKKF